MKAKLTTAYVTGLAVIAILAGATALWSYFAINSEREARLVASTVSRLYRNSQEVIATAAAFRQDYSPSTVEISPFQPGISIERKKQRLRSLVAEIQSDHQFLVSRMFSSESEHAAELQASPSSGERVRQYLALDSEIQKFIRAANQLADGEPYNTLSDHDSVTTILETTNLQITRQLRGLQEAFVQKTGARVTLLQRTLVGSLLAIVAIALLEGLFLFRPLVARANRERNELERKTRELSKANKVKAEFLSNINHELRTPLSAIAGLLEISRTDPALDGHVRQNLNLAQANARRLRVLLDDILDLTKADFGELSVTGRWFDLRPMLAEVLSVYRLQAANRKLRFELNVRGDLPQRVLSDKDRIRQVVDHLAANAIKFTQEGSVMITASYDKRDGTMQFEIKDTGPGISGVTKSQLFSRFTPGNSEMNRSQQGTGVGLALAKIIAEKLDGDLVLTRSDEGGSVFLFSFRPSAVSAETFGASELSADDDMKGRLQGLTNRLVGRKVLVVDDVEENRKILNYFLTRAGAELASATNGQEAVDMLKDDGFDAILMDIQMPLMDGYEATKQIRIGNEGIPIIAVTAHGLQKERQKCFEIGFTDYLVKPVDPILLVELIDRYSRQNWVR